MIAVVDAPLGRGALAALREALAEYKVVHPLTPVTVLVDDNAVGVATRRALASGDLGPVCGDRAGLAAVQFSTVYRYAELLGAPTLAGAGRRPVSTPVVAAAIRRVLRIHPGVFAPVAEHPTTERRLVAAHRELSEVEPAQLDALAATGARAASVVDIHRRVEAALSGAWYNEQDLLDAAALVVGETQGAREPLVLHLPKDLSPRRAALVRRLGEITSLTVIAGRSGRHDADRFVDRSLRRLGIEPAPATCKPQAPTITATSVSDADEEVRHAIRGVLAAARGGVTLDRMAIVYGAREPYARLLHDHLAAAGIPTNGAAVETLASSLPGRTLLRLLGLAERDFRRDDVIDLVAGTPMRWKGRTVPSRAWDELSRAAGVVRGRHQWRDRLAHLRADASARIDAWRSDPDRSDAVARIERRLATIDDLAAFIDDLADRLDAGVHARSWSELARWAGLLLDDHLDGRDRWPEPEQRAFERIETALSRLAGLDEVEPEPTIAVFRRSLELELEAGLGRAGSSGSGLLVGPPSLAAGARLGQVWVLGMAEGTFPVVGRDDSLLPDRERRAAPDLPTSADRRDRQHLDYLTLLAATEDGTVHLFHPRGDLRRSETRTPSRWLLDTLGAQIGHPIESNELDGLDHPAVHHAASFAAGVAVGPAATQTEYDLAVLLHDRALAPAQLPIDDPVLERGAAMLAARRSTSLTRFDGNVGTAGPGVPGRDRPLSATALESWARCPHRFFLQQVLGVEPIDAPEQRLRIDALDRGTLIHRILERFVAEDRADGDDGHPEPSLGAAAGWNTDAFVRLDRIAREECDAVERRGLTGEPLYWRRDRTQILRDLREAIVVDDHRRRRDGSVPHATELAFGFRDAAPVVLDLPDGRAITVRGSIDLVDRRGDGLLVTDYKTGRKGTKLDADDPHQGGTKLQLVIYALAARRLLSAEGACAADAAVESRYWHIHRASRFADNGYRVTREIEEQVLGAIAEIVDMIATGLFPQHPILTSRQDWVDCPWCDPDGLGVGEARRRMERKAADPLLARYLALAEPEAGSP